MASLRSREVRSRDHSHHHHYHHHHRRHQTSEHSEELGNQEQSRSSCTVEKQSDRGESMQLQVEDIIEDATHSADSELLCETRQKTTKEGGSLAAMFDS